MSAQPPPTSAENAFAADLFQDLPPRYDLLAEVLSFGQNGRWRDELVARIVQSSAGRILDVATGTAGVAIQLARQTEAHVAGIDISEAMLGRGREHVRAAGLDERISLQVGRAEELPFPNDSFDAVSFTYLLRYVHDPAATVAELARVLRPGGTLAGLDFFVPQNPAWHAAWWLYTRSILPAAGLVLGGPQWWRVGRFLGPNIENFYHAWPQSRIAAAWRAAGMVEVDHRAMSLGGGLVMWGKKRDA